MIKSICRVFLLVGFSFLFITCSSSSSDDSSGGGGEGDSIANTGAAVAALFGSTESASLNKKTTIPQRLVDLFVRTAIAQAEGAGERNTCDDPDDDGMSDGPEEIETPLTGSTGTYGDTANAGHSIALDDDLDFCLQSDGETANSGDGSDGGGLFASYTLATDVTGTCDNDTTITMVAGANSTGAWRNTDDCFPEVYGNFEMEGGTIVSCHICLNEDQTVDADNTSCSSGGSAVSLTSDVSCTLSTEGGGGDGEDLSCEIAACDADFDCQETADDAITAGDPICADEDSVSCMTCSEGCCQLTE